MDLWTTKLTPVPDYAAAKLQGLTEDLNLNDQQCKLFRHANVTNG
jgi:hypothetical protein